MGIDQADPTGAVELKFSQAMPTGFRISREDGGFIALRMVDRPGRLAGDAWLCHPVDVDSVVVLQQDPFGERRVERIAAIQLVTPIVRAFPHVAKAGVWSNGRRDGDPGAFGQRADQLHIIEKRGAGIHPQYRSVRIGPSIRTERPFREVVETESKNAGGRGLPEIESRGEALADPDRLRGERAPDHLIAPRHRTGIESKPTGIVGERRGVVASSVVGLIPGPLSPDSKASVKTVVAALAEVAANSRLHQS